MLGRQSFTSIRLWNQEPLQPVSLGWIRSFPTSWLRWAGLPPPNGLQKSPAPRSRWNDWNRWRPKGWQPNVSWGRWFRCVNLGNDRHLGLMQSEQDGKKKLVTCSDLPVVSRINSIYFFTVTYQFCPGGCYRRCGGIQIKHQDPRAHLATNKKENSERCFPLAEQETLFIVPKICPFLKCLSIFLVFHVVPNEDKTKVDSDGPWWRLKRYMLHGVCPRAQQRNACGRTRPDTLEAQWLGARNLHFGRVSDMKLWFWATVLSWRHGTGLSLNIEMFSNLLMWNHLFLNLKLNSPVEGSIQMFITPCSGRNQSREHAVKTENKSSRNLLRKPRACAAKVLSFKSSRKR